METKIFGQEKLIKEVQFEVGKWYKGGKDNYYIKFFGFEKCSNYNRIWFSETIVDSVFSNNKDYWANINFEKFALANPVDLSEIQQYLPDGHPDKFTDKSKHDAYIGKWIKIKSLNSSMTCDLEDTGKVHYGAKIGDVVQITGYTYKDGEANKDDPRFYGDNFNLREEDFVIVDASASNPQDTSVQTENAVVHCETQEQWDFVIKKLNYNLAKFVWSNYNKESCIRLDWDYYCYYSYYKNQNYKIYSFQEWCKTFGHTFVSDDFVLPNNWAVKVTKESKPYIKKYRESINYKPFDIPNDYRFQNRNCGGDLYGNIEITLEQFRKYVLKEDLTVNDNNPIKQYAIKPAEAFQQINSYQEKLPIILDDATINIKAQKSAPVTLKMNQDEVKIVINNKQQIKI